MTKYVTGVDCDHNCSIGHFLRLLQEHRAVIEGYVAVGPAGGNPSVELSFNTEKQALDFLAAYYPDERDPDFHKGMVIARDTTNLYLLTESIGEPNEMNDDHTNKGVVEYILWNGTLHPTLVAAQTEAGSELDVGVVLDWKEGVVEETGMRYWQCYCEEEDRWYLIREYAE